MEQKIPIGHIIHEDATESDIQLVSDKGNRIVAEATMQDGDAQNRNTRWYKTHDLKKEIDAPRQQELIEAHEMKGECGHPTDPSITRQQTILPTLTCFRMDKLWMDNNLVKAYVRGTNNALGEEFDMDLREGGKKAFSLRALGSISVEGGRNYVSNLKIITYDYVIYPSHKKAYTNKIVSEAAGMKLNNMISIAESAGNEIVIGNKPGILIPITNDSVMSYIKSESANLKHIFATFDTLCESTTLINNGKNVQLTCKNGDVLVIRLENYIQNEIMDYCSDLNKF